MKIKKWADFKSINEEDEFEEEDINDEGEGNDEGEDLLKDNPSSYIKKAFKILKAKLERIANDEINIELLSFDQSESKAHKSLTTKFKDDVNHYTFIITVDLKYVIDLIKTLDNPSPMDIQSCFVKFKKYDSDYNLIGEITKNLNIEDIDYDLFMELNSEVDDIYGSDNDDFEIEYE